MMTLHLFRTYAPEGTNGLLCLQGKPICSTIELPWRNNKRMISCIPEGRYRLIRGRYHKHGDQIGVMNVPGREAILIHPGNSALEDLQGCIAPVTTHTGPGKGLYSRIALERLKSVVYPVLEAGEGVALLIVGRVDDDLKKVVY